MPACSIQALLSAPNPEDPLADNVAKHWKDNEQEAVATGKLRLPCIFEEGSKSRGNLLNVSISK